MVISMNRFASTKFPVSAVAVCFVLVSILLGCGGDRRESFYPSLADANKDGAITRGWIPEFLPSSSRDIHELHEISPSTEWCAFQFAPADSGTLRKNVQSAEALPQAVRDVPSANVSWWPAMLTGVVDVQQLHKAGFEVYTVLRPETSVTKEVMLFAVDWANGRAFLYRTRE
jgi:hypothetical protein